LTLERKMIEIGLCQCGCGETTSIARQTIPRKNMVKGEPSRFITGHYTRTIPQGQGHPSWRGGRYVNHSGYVMVAAPGHARVNANGYIREHVLIAEKALGSQLPEGVQVHHCGDVGDNSKLVICQDQEYHFLLHVRAKALKECGDANKRKCKFCQQYDHVENLHCRKIKGKKGGWNTYHMECVREYDRARSARRKTK